MIGLPQQSHVTLNSIGISFILHFNIFLRGDIVDKKIIRKAVLEAGKKYHAQYEKAIRESIDEVKAIESATPMQKHDSSNIMYASLMAKNINMVMEFTQSVLERLFADDQ